MAEKGASNGAADPTDTPTRHVLPVTQFARKFSIWSMIKHCIGKDMSRITMPVDMNEPITFLQKQVECFQYCDLIHKACSLQNPIDRMECLAAFVCSTITGSVERFSKPFNPLLGETYELINKEQGFRIICEQVCHHPPVSAFYMESIGRTDGGFKCTGSLCPKIVFWGKSVEIHPKSMNLLELVPFNEFYSWRSVKAVAHNVILGRMWLEYVGRVELTCHSSGLRCFMDFKPAGWFGDPHHVEGTIVNNRGEKVRCIYGKWTESIFSLPVDTWTAYASNMPSAKAAQNGHETSSSDWDGEGREAVDEQDGEEDAMPSQQSSCDLHLNGQKMVWHSIPLPDYARDYFNFSPFTMQLNVPPPDAYRALLPRTDSRLRPDVRYLENGDVDKAAEEKHRIEEKQRAVRRKMQDRKKEWVALWFKEQRIPFSKTPEWVYIGDYWKRDFAKCPDIYGP